MTLAERLKAASLLPPIAPTHYEEIEPGIKVRALPNCPHRGPELRRWEVPCCGGKRRREFMFECGHPDNAQLSATSHMCSRCVLRFGDMRGETWRTLSENPGDQDRTGESDTDQSTLG